MKFSKVIKLVIAVAFISPVIYSQSSVLADTTYEDLESQQYQKGDSPVESVDTGKSSLESNKDYKIRIDFGNLDSLGRATLATAYLNSTNLGKSSLRTPQSFQPVGWYNKALVINSHKIYPQNRGHLIAYTLSFNFDKDGNYTQGSLGSLNNPKNLATQSAYSNQHTMTHYEGLVRRSLQKGNDVTYRVQPVYHSTEKMPRGYWVQAKDSSGNLNFNEYLWNIQPGILFDYSTGHSTIDPGMIIMNPNYRLLQ